MPSKVLAALAFAFLAGTAGAAGLVADPARPLPSIRSGAFAQLLSEQKGAPLVINFWASWCGPCRDELPSLQRLAERWRARGVSVLTVAVADRHEQASRFLWDAGVTLPLLDDADQSAARAFGVRALPTTVILDRDHRVAARARGAIDWDAPVIERQLQDLLK
jgi:thiol-disulfide isomerase/thioredoxin